MIEKKLDRKSNSPSDEQTARARRLEEKIRSMTGERDQSDEPPPRTESPRDHVHRRMRELDEKK